ncbi:VOC family protein [Methylobacterium nodulans]|uniref:3-demethylubiquinone-9 3-methyltransferase n=1 Tax=Methylobacterium nodulans (strain LMG 21967 / CNCM I-2342 / ORS 2060) TaxID=460265 RepID=B8IGF5_METNO|nr:VOC family protein [Methylobacterium nodulans]ACL55855.1 3-demethylubiquinone-9 3-methyltransferase [Methylobacterium nodulans ORS 2060]
MICTVTPFLMFEGKAEEALSFYASTLPNSRLIEIERYGADGPGAEGSVKLARFSIGGLVLMCTDSPVPHSFTFTPSISLFVNCGSEEDLVRLAEALGAGGEVLMPLGNYGFSRKFGWFKDRYGVSWQLNLE